MKQDPNIELGADEPDIDQIIRELEQGQADALWFFQRMQQAREWWYSRWLGQTVDGRKHTGVETLNDDEGCFPWEGAADSRQRTVATLIKEHVSVIKYAFFKAKIQARSVRPLNQPGESLKATKLLQWRLYNHMWSELLREVPLVANYWQGYGLGLLSVQWEQERRLAYIDINLPILAEVLGAGGPNGQGMNPPSQGYGVAGGSNGQGMNGSPGSAPDTGATTGMPGMPGMGMPTVGAGVSPAGMPGMGMPNTGGMPVTMGGVMAGGGLAPMLLQALMDPDMEDTLTTLLQSLSPILSRPDARNIVQSLRETGQAKIPTAYPYLNKPRWRALKPCVDCLFPSETSDIQEARWYMEREWISETELEDRIDTEGYDPEFVDAAKEHKGQPTETPMMEETRAPLYYGSKRDLIEISHFYYKALMEGVPCILKTIFNPLVKDKKGNNLWAKHGPFEYEHGQYPVVAFARRFEDRRLLWGMGIAEEAYTDEQAIKVQQDGLTDRTSLIHRPPMIVPQNKVGAVRGAYRPGAILGVGRTNEINWGPLPPTDGTPVEVIQMVVQNLDRRYALFGTELDPSLKQLRTQELADDALGNFSLAIEQTWQLMQQYETPLEVAAVVGQLAVPFPVGREEIQGKHEITATIDMSMLDEDYAQKKLTLIGQAMAFKQEGVLFDMAVEAIDPDAADALKQSETSPAAQEKETQDELNAISQAFAGIEPPLPMYANNQLRLQVLVQNTLQSQNPLMMQRLRANPDTQKILMNRAQFFQNQIQQYTQNPTIGRALATSTFAPLQAPQLTNGAPQAASAIQGMQ